MGLLHDLIWGKPVNGGSEGGGGSSDFSTAEVTLRCSKSGVEIKGVLINPDDELGYFESALPSEQFEATITAPLYKGYNSTFITNIEPTKEGDATIQELENEYQVTVEGDCILWWKEAE